MYKRFIIPGVVIAIGVLFYISYCAQLKREFALSQKEKGFVFVKVLPVQTSLGWGYEIHVDNKTYIKQPFIPAISGRRGFDTKDQALLVGNKVVSNINTKMSPSISINDLIELGIPIKIADTLVIKR
jgi:Domain of unknown function (DUF4907)